MFRFKWIFFVGFLILLVSCQNLFNPSGKQSTGDMDADALIASGERELRANHYTSAKSYFNSALKKDSTKSLAYLGLAKATIRSFDINPQDMIEIVLNFASEEDGESTDIYTAMSEVMGDRGDRYTSGIDSTRVVIRPFLYRDSINNLYNMYQDSVSADTISDADLKTGYESFITNFIDSDTPPIALAEFPLVDKEIKAGRLRIDMDLMNLIFLVGGITQITKLAEGLAGDTEGMVQDLLDGNLNIAETEMYQKAVEDSAYRDSINDLLDNIGSSMDAGEDLVGSVLDMIGSDDTTGQADSLKNPDGSVNNEKIDEVLGDAEITEFYRLGDRKDNDGDGCIDEELADGIDNDFDGIVDEDIRLTALDFVDNDNDGSIDEQDEILNANNQVQFEGFTQGDSIASTPYKLSVAQDINKEISLSKRRTNIGACWHNWESLP